MTPSELRRKHAAADRLLKERIREDKERRQIVSSIAVELRTFEKLAPAADALLQKHVFDPLSGFFGGVKAIFSGPLYDHARAAGRKLTPEEMKIFLELDAVISRASHAAGDAGVRTMLHETRTRHLYSDIALLSRSQSFLGILRGIEDARKVLGIRL